VPATHDKVLITGGRIGPATSTVLTTPTSPAGTANHFLVDQPLETPSAVVLLGYKSRYHAFLLLNMARAVLLHTWQFRLPVKIPISLKDKYPLQAASTSYQASHGGQLRNCNSFHNNSYPIFHILSRALVSHTDILLGDRQEVPLSKYLGTNPVLVSAHCKGSGNVEARLCTS